MTASSALEGAPTVGGAARAIEPFKGRRVYLVLREAIVSGGIAPGERLPGEPALATAHGVARATVRRALDQLAAEGLVHRRSGAGTYARAPAVAGPVAGDLTDVVRHLVEMGGRTRVRLLAFGYGAPPAAVAAALRLGPGERAQRAVRVRLLNEAPFSHLTTYVPERVGLTYAPDDLATTPLLALLERSGVVVERAKQSISATLAGPEAAGALGVAVGAPLLALTRVVFDPRGRGVEHLRALYRPDRYAFESDLARAGAGDARHWAPAPSPLARPANSDDAPPPGARTTLGGPR